jgi:hypothetical protein
MQAYRCGNCRADLIPEAQFCVQCDSSFASPVPEGAPVLGASPYLVPESTPLGQSRRFARDLAIALSLVAVVCIGLFFSPTRSGQKIIERSLVASHDPRIMEALNADIEADKDKSLASRQRATDVMLQMSSQCTIHHAVYSRHPGDSVLMIANRPLTQRQARNRTLFAAYLLRDLRADFFPDPASQVVRITLLDTHGVRLASTVARPMRSRMMFDGTDKYYIL